MIKGKIIRLNELVLEFLEVNAFYKRYMRRWKSLSKKYESGQLSYEEFKVLEDKLFNGRGVKDFKQEQMLYAYALLKQMISVLDSLIADVYKDKVEVQAVPAKQKHRVEQVVNEAVRRERAEGVEAEREKEAVRERSKAEVSKEVRVKPQPVAPASTSAVQDEQNKKISVIRPSSYSVEHTALRKQTPEQKKQRHTFSIKDLLHVFNRAKSSKYIFVTEPNVKYEVPEKSLEASVRERVKVKIKSSSENENFKLNKPEEKTVPNLTLQKHQIVKEIRTNVQLPKRKHFELHKSERRKGLLKSKRSPALLETKKFYKFTKGKTQKAPNKSSSSTARMHLNRRIQLGGASPASAFKYFQLAKRLREQRKVENKKANSEDLVSDKNFVPVAVELLNAKKEKKEILTPQLKAEVEQISKVVVPKQVYKSYTTTTIASVSNMMVRGLSAKLLSLYPDFFRSFYHKLRSAEIPLLSNTYINIMLFFMIITAMLSFSISLVTFLIISPGFLTALAKSLLISLLASSGVFLMFYLYPISLISEKSKDLRRNLPFAINQMAAIASANLPPLTIFKIVASNNEYGEVSRELAKIVNYVELFGIDFLVAVKSIASTTPNEFFKDFLQGLILTVNSGEKLDAYLKQKAKEALGIYEREIEKYNETVSTLSDIYTAILIAAPLLMIASLSLIQMIGGKIAGFGVGFLMAVATYVVLPVLNLLFIMVVKMMRTSV